MTAELGEHVKLYAGIDARGYRQHNYKTVKDLLGGNYWISKDKYVDSLSLDNPELLYYDVDNMDKHLTVGDKFGYDYSYNVFRQNLWATLQLSYKHIDFHVGISGSVTEMWRKGYMRYGCFLNDALGNSSVKLFPDYGVKTGLSYKVDNYNTLTLNAQWQTQAPCIANSFVNPSYSNRWISDIVSEKDLAADFSYVMNYSFLKMRVSAYFIRTFDEIGHFNFYHDLYGCFVNYSMTGIDKQHVGAEVGIEVPIGKMFAIAFAGNYGDFIYVSRPKAVITAKNGYDELSNGKSEVEKTIYWKNFHVPGTPQIAATLGVKFNYKDWRVKVSANYFDKIYASMNSERRTTDARGYLDSESDTYKAIVAQEKITGQFTMDASVSKSWKIKKNSVGFSVSVKNITNNKHLVTSVSEQHRFDYNYEENGYDADKFANKYYYAMGTTFTIGFNYTFN